MMNELDKQKEWIGIWQIIVFLLLGREVNLIVYISDNYGELNKIQLIFSIMSLLFVVIVAIFLQKKIDRARDINA